MRFRILSLIIMITLAGTSLLAQVTPPPDYNATGTAIAQEATLTAQAGQSQPQQPTAGDAFQQTSTALIQQATQTAEAFTGRTAIPVINTPIGGEEAFALTATQLVWEATQTAIAQATPEGPSSPMISTGLILVLVVLVLGGLGALFAYTNQSGKR